MPRYGYYCPKCDPEIENSIDIIKSSDTQELCNICNTVMERNFNRRGIHCGNKSYGNTPIISESLGIHPEQAAEHRRNHPNVEILPMGQLKFSNYQSHDKYLRDIGWNKPCVRKEI